MDFKSSEIRDQYNNAPVLLQVVLCEFERIALFLGKPITITSVFREKGSHSNYCCADIRDEHNGERTFDDEHVEIILKYMNKKFKRLDGYKTVIHHKVDGSTYHFHVQTGVDAVNLRGPLYKEP